MKINQEQDLKRIAYEIEEIVTSANPKVIKERMHRNLLRVKRIYSDLLADDNLGAIDVIAKRRNVSRGSSELETLLRTASITEDWGTIKELERIVEDGLFLSEKEFEAYVKRELKGNLGITPPSAGHVVWTGT